MNTNQKIEKYKKFSSWQFSLKIKLLKTRDKAENLIKLGLRFNCIVKVAKIL